MSYTALVWFYETVNTLTSLFSIFIVTVKWCVSNRRVLIIWLAMYSWPDCFIHRDPRQTGCLTWFYILSETSRREYGTPNK